MTSILADYLGSKRITRQSGISSEKASDIIQRSNTIDKQLNEIALLKTYNKTRSYEHAESRWVLYLEKNPDKLYHHEMFIFMYQYVTFISFHDLIEILQESDVITKYKIKRNKKEFSLDDFRWEVEQRCYKSFLDYLKHIDFKDTQLIAALTLFVINLKKYHSSILRSDLWTFLQQPWISQYGLFHFVSVETICPRIFRQFKATTADVKRVI